jgi:hypothetical protein
VRVICGAVCCRWDVRTLVRVGANEAAGGRMARPRGYHSLLRVPVPRGEAKSNAIRTMRNWPFPSGYTTAAAALEHDVPGGCVDRAGRPPPALTSLAP